jgi:hypothetical protein
MASKEEFPEAADRSDPGHKTVSDYNWNALVEARKVVISVLATVEGLRKHYVSQAFITKEVKRG